MFHLPIEVSVLAMELKYCRIHCGLSPSGWDYIGHVMSCASRRRGRLCIQVPNLCLLKKKKEKEERELGTSLPRQTMSMVTVSHERVELARNNSQEYDCRKKLQEVQEMLCVTGTSGVCFTNLSHTHREGQVAMT